MQNALQAAENLQLQIKYKDQILNASKLVEKDPAGYHLWDTPKGRWWIPEGDDFVLPFNLAEQERKIYGTGAAGRAARATWCWIAAPTSASSRAWRSTAAPAW